VFWVIVKGLFKNWVEAIVKERGMSFGNRLKIIGLRMVLRNSWSVFETLVGG